MGNKNIVRQKLFLMNLYAISHDITIFENNEILTINNYSTLTLLWQKCGPTVCAREMLKDYEILHQKHMNKLLHLTNGSGISGGRGMHIVVYQCIWIS